jgi:hypothetical protein
MARPNDAAAAAAASATGIVGESWTRRSAQFARDGFALSDGPVLPPDVVARARASFERIVARADAGEYSPQASMVAPHVQDVVHDLAAEDAGGAGGLRKVEMPQLDTSEHGIAELMNRPELAAWCQEVTGADWLQVWWIQLHGKPGGEGTDDAGDGTSIGFHQDKNYWNSSFDISENGAEESEIFTAWIALSDVGPDSGPMQLLRGSHLWANGLMQIPAFFHHQDLLEQRDVALSSVGLGPEEWEPVPAVLPAGGVSVHDWRTLHGSGPNHSDEMRMSLAIHMRTGRSWPRSNEPGENYLDQFLHDRRPHCCPVVLGDPAAIRGDRTAPIFADAAAEQVARL